MNPLAELSERLRSALGDQLQTIVIALDEVTIVIKGQDHLSVARTLRDDPTPCIRAIDRSVRCRLLLVWGGRDGARYAVVMHLLSLKHNWRVRVRSFCAGR